MNFIDRVSGTVESPLEEMMLEAFKTVIGDKLVLVSQEDAREMRRWAFDDEGRKHVYLAPQAKLGKYRCDFLLAVHKPWIHPTTICVEVDGKHHREAKQRQKDEERDRYMRRRQIETMRFPGWKVNKDPFRCVHTIMEKLLGEPMHTEGRWVGELSIFYDAASLNERSQAISNEANFSFLGGDHE